MGPADRKYQIVNSSDQCRKIKGVVFGHCSNRLQTQSQAFSSHSKGLPSDQVLLMENLRDPNCYLTIFFECEKLSLVFLEFGQILEILGGYLLPMKAELKKIGKEIFVPSRGKVLWMRLRNNLERKVGKKGLSFVKVIIKAKRAIAQSDFAPIGRRVFSEF